MEDTTNGAGDIMEQQTIAGMDTEVERHRMTWPWGLVSQLVVIIGALILLRLL
jgi:hypothetical protein